MDAESRRRHLRLVEALLFAAAEPVAEAELLRRLPADVDAAELVAELQRHYAGRGVELHRVGDSWAFRTAADLGPALRLQRTVRRKLSRAGLETLAVIAYHQPVTRAEIEEIRGVSASRGTFEILLEAGWVRPHGRRRAPGRPVTWVTSAAFLDHFGLENIRALPGLDDLKAAGLLDARPALLAYSDGVSPPEPDDDEGDADSQASLTLTPDLDQLDAEEEAGALDIAFAQDADPGGEAGGG